MLSPKGTVYIDEIPAHLDTDALSGYDADGPPLEHSDVVHDFLAHLAEQMQRMHREKQDLWKQERTTFVQGGIHPDELTSLSVTKPGNFTNLKTYLF